MNGGQVENWCLLVVSLPTGSATARVRVWRALKTLGCAALRDGAYLLPASDRHEGALQELAQECSREGGVAWQLAVRARTPDEQTAFVRLFDRSAEYAGLREGWKEARQAIGRLPATELARLQRRLQREYAAVQAIDFFPGEASAEAAAQWAELLRRMNETLSPNEPRPAPTAIVRLEQSHYQGRTWATRRRPWVDRVASAWLIRRFIDRDARLLWLARPSDCPPDALGFDFDGATFSHVGDRVTFETLLASFGLEDDRGLQRLAALVHQLDVGGEPVPEAAGFEAVLAGARERLDDDDALLAHMTTVLDSLYAHFARDA